MSFLPARVCLIAAILCSSAIALIMRFFRQADNRYGMLEGNYLTCSLIGFLMIGNSTALLHCDPSTVFLGIMGGFFYLISLVCMQTGIRTNGAILTSAFGKLGLVVPLLLSILFFHETPGILHAAGLLFVIAAVWTISGGSSETEVKKPWFLVVVLLTSGSADAMAKVFNVFGIASQSSEYFFLIFFSAALCTLVLLYLETKKTGKRASLRDYLSGVLVGIPNYFSSVFLLQALSGIPAYIAYPVFSTGTILFVTLISALFFHERPTRRQLAGLIMILAALILLNI